MDRERIGKYKIVGELGRGTMGEVYKAHDPVLNRFVALKTLPLQLGPDNETLQRFQREAQAAALLNHPNIVTVHDFGEEKGLLYMAMELLEGIDLREAIDRELLGSLDDKLNALDSVLAGLDYAHGKGVIHRDIKPANIHLGKDHRQVKIMDFGLARVSTSEMTQDGIVLGTPNYMSPEQALGDKVDGRADLFSTGAVLYELLTGHKPFEAETTPSVLFQVVHKEPMPVGQWAPDMPAGVVSVVNRALEKDLKRRFASAGDMRAALSIARNGAASAARQGSHSMPARPTPPPLPANAARPAGTSAIPPPIRLPGAPTSAIGPPSALKPRGPRLGLPALVLGAGLAAIMLVAVAVFLWLRPAAPARPAAATDALTQELVRKQLRLAQAELENKNYRAALSEAQGVLKLAAGNPEATAVITAAQERLGELDRSVAEARRLLEAGDNDGASRQLSKVLELDAQYPPAAELSTRLNGAFKAQADDAATQMRTAREAARTAGAGADALQKADETARRGDEQVTRGEFALATGSFIEARDVLESARRAASRRAARPVAAAPPVTVATPPPPRGFTADATKVTAPDGGGPAGFEGAQMSHRAPQFSGRMEFEVLPPAVRPGEPFVVRIHLRNEGRKSVKIRALSIAAFVDGQRTPASAKPLLKEVHGQSRGLVAEYSGVWDGAREWVLEAVVTADKDEQVVSRLKAN